MKNVKPSQLKKAIFLEEDEFKDILNQVFGKSEDGEEIEVEISQWGLWIGYHNSKLSYEEITTGLAQYFDVYKVTSIHADDCDYVGIWVIYQN